MEIYPVYLLLIIIIIVIFRLYRSHNIENDYPIFRVRYEEKFPLEGSILSIAKRKVMNYIFQTIKIQELKS